MQRFIFAIGLVAMLGLAGCSSVDGWFGDEPTAPAANLAARETVGQANSALQPDPNLSPRSVQLEAEVPELDWLGPAGNSSNWPGHPMLAAERKLVWQQDIGAGSSRELRLIAKPVAVDDKVFAVDAEGVVSAYAALDGKRLWRTETRPENAENDAMAGGLALPPPPEPGETADSKIYVATGHGEVVALEQATGAIVWRRATEQAMRAAPAVAGGRVVVTDTGNVTLALDAASGRVLWRHAGATEATALLGSASPAIVGDLVVVAHSTGEVFALRAQNGRMVWSDAVSRTVAVSGLAALNAIRASPMVARGGVFVLSASGPLAAIASRSGERVWEQEIGGSQQPALSGNAFYVLNSEQQLFGLLGPTGRVIWESSLPRLTDPTDTDSDPIVWSGPTLAGSKLYLTNSQGELVEISPFNGSVTNTTKLPGKSLLAPIVARQTLYVLTDSGQLVAYR